LDHGGPRFGFSSCNAPAIIKTISTIVNPIS
jgi:hypothetical protein